MWLGNFNILMNLKMKLNRFFVNFEFWTRQCRIDLQFNGKIFVKITMIPLNLDILIVEFQHFNGAWYDRKYICGNLEFSTWQFKIYLLFNCKTVLLLDEYIVIGIFQLLIKLKMTTLLYYTFFKNWWSRNDLSLNLITICQ